MTLNSVNCTKNPKHRNFIPIKRLSSNHLPKPFDRQKWVEYIKLLSKDTVRLSVSRTSSGRTEDIGFRQFIGTDHVRNGSGTAFLGDMRNEQPCRFRGCTECFEGDRKTSGVFKVVTAAHVVFDDEEAAHTIVEFFVEDESGSQSGVIRAQGVKTSSVNVEKNRTVLMCVTHDKTLFSKLKKWQNERLELLKELQVIQGEDTGMFEADSSSGQGQSAGQRQGNMAVVISHPHGCSKHVSVGKMLVLQREGEVRNVEEENQKLVGCLMSYDADTCPGSGGGSVNVFGEDQVFLAFAPHCATSREKENVSGLGWTVNVD